MNKKLPSLFLGILLLAMNVSVVLADTITVMMYGTEITVGRGPSPGPFGAIGPRFALYSMLKDQLSTMGHSLDFVGSKSEGVRNDNFDTDWEGIEGPTFRVHGLGDSIGSVLAPYSGLDFIVFADIILWDAFFGATPNTLVTDVEALLKAVHSASPETKIILGTSSGDIFRSQNPYQTYNNLLPIAVGDMSYVTLVNLDVFTSSDFISQILLKQPAYDRMGGLFGGAILSQVAPAPVPLPPAMLSLILALGFLALRQRRKT